MDVGFIAQPPAMALEHQSCSVEQARGSEDRLDALACRGEQGIDDLSRPHEPQLGQPPGSTEDQVKVSDGKNPVLHRFAPPTLMIAGAPGAAPHVTGVVVHHAGAAVAAFEDLTAEGFGLTLGEALK